jgi:hypothetical protein
MANNKLTGPYDAVAQISRRQINGLIAALHQNGATDEPPLRLGHRRRSDRKASLVAIHPKAEHLYSTEFVELDRSRTSAGHRVLRGPIETYDRTPELLGAAMRRREFITLVGGAAHLHTGKPDAFAQQPAS